MVGNLWTVRAPPRTRLEELTALTENPRWWGEGLLLPPREPHPRALGLRKFGLDFRPIQSWPVMKNPRRTLGCPADHWQNNRSQTAATD